MTHSTVAPPEAGPRPETAEEPRLPSESRPYRFRAWTSRGLRRLTGVDEDLLEEVPEERPRYTLQGLVVVCTSLLAGIAVFVALGRFTDTPWPLLVPAAAFWAGLILVFDCWMLSTMHGVKKGHRFRDYTGRIILAVLVSVVVAEPLLLYVFRPSVEQEIRVDRQQEEAAFRSSLERCNPVSGEQSADPSCTEEFLLTVGGSTLTADRSALAATVAERDRVQEHVDSLQSQLEEKQELARLECNGSPGDGLTGRAGEGVNCRRLRGEADAFEEDSRLSSYQANLLELDSQVEDLTSASGVSTADFASARGELIDEKVADRTAAEGEHGIIDEMEALGELARGNFYVMAAVLLLRLLLVAVDLFPVLTKVLGGASKYDELYTARADFHRERHGEKLRIRRKQLQVDTDRDVGRLDAQQQADRNENDRRMRSDKVRQRAVLEDEIARQASQYRGQRETDGEGRG